MQPPISSKGGIINNLLLRHCRERLSYTPLHIALCSGVPTVSYIAIENSIQLSEFEQASGLSQLLVIPFSLRYQSCLQINLLQAQLRLSDQQAPPSTYTATTNLQIFAMPTILSEIIINTLLRYGRERYKLTITQVAKRSGITEDDYTALEQGLRLPEFDEAEQLARLFSLPVSYLYQSCQQTYLLQQYLRVAEQHRQYAQGTATLLS